MEEVYAQNIKFVTIDDENRPGEKITIMVPNTPVNNTQQ